MELTFAFRVGETAGERALLGLTGLLAIALSLTFAVRPDVGAITVAQVYGLFSLFAGVSSVVIASNLRHAGNLTGLSRLAA